MFSCSNDFVEKKSNDIGEAIAQFHDWRVEYDYAEFWDGEKLVERNYVGERSAFPEWAGPAVDATEHGWRLRK
jgi:hypothetical protein